MVKKYVKMGLDGKAHKLFKTIMKKMNFKNENHFLRYCVLKTTKSKIAKSQQKLVTKELKMLKSKG